MPENPPSYKLYPIWAITGAAVVGGFFGGGVLVALDFRSLGQPQAVKKTIVFSMAGLLFEMMCVGFIGVPQSDVMLWIFQVVLRVLQGVVGYFVARKVLGKALEQHVQAGARLHLGRESSLQLS